MKTRITTTAATWAKIKADYLTGRYSCKDLADIHKIGHDAIVKRCGREKWAESLSEQNAVIGQTVSERVRELSEELAHRRVDHIRKSVDLSARLLDKLEKRVTCLPDDTPIREVRHLVSAFRELLEASQTPLGISRPSPSSVTVNANNAAIFGGPPPSYPLTDYTQSTP